ncbi:ankyrin repeat, PH and SEC7 domain containing protein secG-like [Haliotis asinina]|uniref:ankyrin repeat, PH and SEC7 domain containing protein secG-like n=1 Tax=Haliotis asinina TaxID=109174 RepID=UPI0035318BB7
MAIDSGKYLTNYHRRINIISTDGKQKDPEKSLQHKVDKQESFANSPLHEACRIGDLQQVKHIMSRGSVNINSKDEKHGRTPLMVAAHEGHCRIFEFLITKGANKSEVDSDCKNFLHWACMGAHVAMVDCLLQQYGIVKNVRLSPLLQAAMKGNINVFELFACTGSNVSRVDLNGYNVLHFACMGEHMSLVKYIVSQGSVDINSRSIHGLTPLMFAVVQHCKDIFDFLLSMGANVSCVDNRGRNVLHYACSQEQVAMVKYLVSRGSVDINSRRTDGMTPLMTVALKGNKYIFELLVSRGANVSHVDDRGNNILHSACMGEDVAMVKYRVSQGSVNINSRNNDGMTPLAMAASKGNTYLFDVLVRMGANASHVDDNGYTILHMASSCGRVEMANHIMSQNLVDINASDKDGKTAAIIAQRDGKSNVYPAGTPLLFQRCQNIET